MLNKVARLMATPDASTTSEVVRFRYAGNGRTVTIAMGETALRGGCPATSGTTLPPWSARREWDGNPQHCPTNCNVEWGREFRYDGARQRYLTRALNPATLQEYESYQGHGFTDYDGDRPYGDYRIPGPYRIAARLCTGDGPRRYRSLALSARISTAPSLSRYRLAGCSRSRLGSAPGMNPDATGRWRSRLG